MAFELAVELIFMWIISRFSQVPAKASDVEFALLINGGWLMTVSVGGFGVVSSIGDLPKDKPNSELRDTETGLQPSCKKLTKSVRTIIETTFKHSPF